MHEVDHLAPGLAGMAIDQGAAGIVERCAVGRDAGGKRGRRRLQNVGKAETAGQRFRRW